MRSTQSLGSFVNSAIVSPQIILFALRLKRSWTDFMKGNMIQNDSVVNSNLESITY